MSKVIVSTIMITYGHETFLKQAIESVLEQECSFDMELIVADDNSPDNTQNIVSQIIKEHPNGSCITYLKRHKNIGMMPNFMDAIKYAKGSYIALCEGDDYWTDRLKLQKQVDFMHDNPEYSACFHSVDVIYQDGIEPFLPDINELTPLVTTIFDILKGNFIHTVSVLFRNSYSYPDWMLRSYPGDWPLHVLNATHGKFRFIKDSMACYRVHYGGVHSTTKGNVEKSLDTFKNLCDELVKRNCGAEAQIAKQYYNNAYVTFFAINDDNPNRFNRLEKSLLLLTRGTLKLKLLFWIPLLFGTSSKNVYNLLMKLNKTYIHGQKP
ncbi:MAG: glycosyltransferase [Pedobacter sp.]